MRCGIGRGIKQKKIPQEILLLNRKSNKSFVSLSGAPNNQNVNWFFLNAISSIQTINLQQSRICWMTSGSSHGNPSHTFATPSPWKTKWWILILINLKIKCRGRKNYKPKIIQFLFRFDQKPLGVLLGDHNLYTLNPIQLFAGVDKVFIHPDFNVPSVLNNNLALLHLDKKIRFSSKSIQ